ncbi:hypothetical protein pdam_00007852 [Pocillopora damicornis]|uniref:Uncharacterized protein n=1 Tax=Pocillopora damicornis TaxID=46731 RepID=A0A3M6TXU9_POCDA|nr:hypothetical protein pdam_00007852 [Pocillopora damicornis]
MATIQALNNFSFESESLEKRTMWTSFYPWESFRTMVLHVHENRLQYQPTIHLWRGLSFEEGEEVYKIFSTGAVIFTRGILTRRRNRQQGKSCLCCT